MALLEIFSARATIVMFLQEGEEFDQARHYSSSSRLIDSVNLSALARIM